MKSYSISYHDYHFRFLWTSKTERLHQSVWYAHARLSASRWQCLLVCRSWGKRSWYSSILQWRSIAHTTVYDVLLTQQLLPVVHEIWETSSFSSKSTRHNQTSWTGDTRVHCTRPVAPNSPLGKIWWVAQTCACVYSCQRRIFWAFSLIQGHACDNFSVLSLWILKENCCYCVNYVRFLLFLIFCISQGSVATRLRCGGKFLLQSSCWVQ